MASHEYNINAALNAHLSTLPDAPPIAWGNDDFDPEGATLWLIANQLPRNTDAPFLGDTSAQDYGGIYQVTIMSTLGSYEGDALIEADKVISHFQRGLTLESGGTKVRIRSAYRSPGLVDGTRYAIPVSIRYRGII